MRRIQPGDKPSRNSDGGKPKQEEKPAVSEPAVQETAAAEEDEAPKEESAGRERSRRSYPRPKKHKTMNTDEYMAQNGGEKA